MTLQCLENGDEIKGLEHIMFTMEDLCWICSQIYVGYFSYSFCVLSSYLFVSFVDKGLLPGWQQKPS